MLLVLPDMNKNGVPASDNCAATGKTILPRTFTSSAAPASAREGSCRKVSVTEVVGSSNLVTMFTEEHLEVGRKYELVLNQQYAGPAH